MGYRYAGLTELATALARRSVTSAELATQAIDALESIGRRYNAVATLLPDRAQHEAKLADRHNTSGDSSILRGIPYAVKDLFAARGGPTTWGSRVFASREFDSDAAVVRRIGRERGVLVAKLAMSEFAGGGRPAKPGASMHGQGRNPWNPARYSGGSSSGSGIAVALGLIPYALGTETGGSIIGPAGFSGVTGVRTTFGLVPRDGVMTLSWTLDKVGPLARSADDCATVLEVIAGRRRFRALSRSEADDLRRTIRVAWIDAEFEEAAPSIRGRLATAIDEFRRVAPTFIETSIPRHISLIDPLELIVKVEGAFQLRDLIREPTFKMSDERQLATLRSGLETPTPDYLAAMRVAVPAAQAAFESVFRVVDVILSASRTTIAPSLTEDRSPRDAAKMSDLLRAAGNLAGVPGISFPCGLSEEGMPVGLQLIGPRGSDAILLALAAAYQRSTGHHELRPPDPLSP